MEDIVTGHAQEQSTRVRNRLGGAVIITVGVWVWVELVGIFIGYSPRAGPLVLEGFPVIRDVGVQVLRALLALIVVLVATRVFDISSPVEWMEVRRPVGREWLYIPLGVILAFVWLLGALILIRNVLGLERTETALVTFTAGVRLSRVLTGLVLIGPAEEVIFHGVVQRSLEDVIGLWPAIFIGGLLFGVAHLEPAAVSGGDLLFYAAQGGFGVIAGWIYARTDNLVIPALVHGIFVSITTGLPLIAG